MNNYFRITGYNKENDFCFILDCFGMFEKLWQFSAYIIEKGFAVLEVSKEENMLDVNITKVEEDKEHIFLQASAYGKPTTLEQTINGVTYKAIKVGDKIYIPDNTKLV